MNNSQFGLRRSPAGQTAAQRPLKVAWISFFPIEWLPDLPVPLRQLPRQHPAPWQRVLVEELKTEPGLELHVFSVRKHFPRTCEFQRDGVTFHCLKVPGGLRTLSLFWWETLLLRRHLRQIQPDLVHAWGTERGAALVASRLPYPYLVTMQGLLGWILQFIQPDFYVRLETRLERVSLRRASVVTAESSFANRWLRDHYPHLDVRQAEHAPNWLFHHVERRPLLRPLRFLHVGAPSHLKGTDLLVRALDRLRPELDFQLTLVGVPAPAYLDPLKSAVPGVWDRITVRHNLTQSEVAEEMAQAAILLFPTRVDNSPNAVKEAVVAGLPVVGSSVGGILDYVVPGQNGLHCPPDNLDAFTQQVRAAVAHPLFGQGRVDPQTLRQMRHYLSPQTMRDRFLATYRHVAALGRCGAASAASASPLWVE